MPRGRESLSQEPGKGTPKCLWGLNKTSRLGSGCGGGLAAGTGVDGGRFWPRRDLGGSRGCLYCCRLAPPSVFLAVSATVSSFQSQKPPLEARVLTATPSYIQSMGLPLPPFLWDPAPRVPKPVPLKRENIISRQHLYSLVVLKTILHLLNNTNILYSSMFIMKGIFETVRETTHSKRHLLFFTKLHLADNVSWETVKVPLQYLKPFNYLDSTPTSSSSIGQLIHSFYSEIASAFYIYYLT